VDGKAAGDHSFINLLEDQLEQMERARRRHANAAGGHGAANPDPVIHRNLFTTVKQGGLFGLSKVSVSPGEIPMSLLVLQHAICLGRHEPGKAGGP
jgi:hypothetical protein